MTLPGLKVKFGIGSGVTMKVVQNGRFGNANVPSAAVVTDAFCPPPLKRIVAVGNGAIELDTTPRRVYVGGVGVGAATGGG